MKIIQESKEIVGKLVTQGQPFDMLQLSPTKRPSVPFWMSDVYEFLIINGQGFAQTIIVSKGGFYFLPALEYTSKIVSFIVPDDEETEDDRRRQNEIDNRLEELQESD